jgi:hypothetical protein
VSTLDSSEEFQPVGRALPDLMCSPRSSRLAAHSSHTHLDGLIAAPSSEKDVLLWSARRALAGGGYEYHAVKITKVCRVDDILCRDSELSAGSRKVSEYDVAILNEFVDAIARFEVGGPSLKARIAVEEFVCRSRGRCARRLSWRCADGIAEVEPL